MDKNKKKNSIIMLKTMFFVMIVSGALSGIVELILDYIHISFAEYKFFSL